MHTLVRAEIFRIARFGIVGLSAMLTHIVIANLVLAHVTASPYVSSLAGFLVAFGVSYLGHYHFTFGGPQSKGHGKALPQGYLQKQRGAGARGGRGALHGRAAGLLKDELPRGEGTR